MGLKMNRRVWAIGFACLAMFVLGMSDNIRGPLYPELLLFFNLTNAQGSLSFAVASTAAFFGNIFAGALLRNYTLSRVLCISIFAMGAGLATMGISSTYIWYIVGAALFGGSMGLVALTQNVLVAESVDGPSQSKALSGLHGIYGLSSLLAPLVASFSTAFFGSWRSAFLVTAIFAGIVALAASLYRARPRFEVHQAPEKVKNHKNSKKALLLFGGLLAFYVVAEIMISTRLALYMRTYFAMDLEKSSYYVTGFFVMLLLGRLIFAIRTFTATYKAQLNSSLLASIICLALGLTVHPLFFVLLGMAMAPFYPVSVAYIAEQTGIFQRQFITFALSFQSLCVIAMHLGVGYLRDHFGLFYAFGVGIISLILSLICVNYHPKVSQL